VAGVEKARAELSGVLDWGEGSLSGHMAEQSPLAFQLQCNASRSIVVENATSLWMIWDSGKRIIRIATITSSK
jgi:hypothetical protein